MTKKSIILVVGLVVLGGGLGYLIGQARISSSAVSRSSDKISVILTGFGAKNQQGVWEGEPAPFLGKLDRLQDVSKNMGMCQSGFEGYLYGNKVLVAVSGMAKVRTTACLMDILKFYGKRVKEVVVVGIAGISPAKVAMMGDVCINSLAYDFDLQHYSADKAGTTMSEPVFWPQESNFISQSTRGDQGLARELFLASSWVEWPAVPQNVKEVDILYHQTSRDPKAWGPDECMEVTSDLYWHDIKADARARELAAGYMQEVYGRSVSPADVVAATSMEAVPAGVLVDWWNKSNAASIAFAYVRGASNFDQVYLNSDGTPALDGRASIEELKNSDLSEFAIQTAALPVLKMFELRNAHKTGNL